MKIGRWQVKRRLFVGTGLAILVTGAWIVWTDARRTKAEATRREPEAFVRVAGAGDGREDRVLAERAEYFDPAPLFLPTAHNYPQGGLPARAVRQPGQVFADFDPKFNFGDSGLRDYGEASEVPAAVLGDVLVGGNQAPFAGFDQVDQPVGILAKRGAFIDVKSMKDGALCLSLPWYGFEAGPEFAPAEFLVAVTSAGLIGEPVTVTSSGRDETDGRIRDLLVRSARLGERLAPGRYLVSVGP